MSDNKPIVIASPNFKRKIYVDFCNIHLFMLKTFVSHFFYYWLSPRPLDLTALKFWYGYI